MAEDPEWKPQQDQDMSLLCRVCANQHDYLIPIFQGEGLDHDMPTKMDKHLPIKVRETDKLPTQMCYQCASTIIAWSELHTNCLAADKKLKAMLKMIVKKPSTVETTADSDDVASDHYEDAYDDGGGAADDDDNDDEDFEKEIKQLISDAGVELGSKSKASKRQPARATTSRKRKSELTITPVKREPKKPKTEPSASKSSTALLKPKEEVVTNEDRCMIWACCKCIAKYTSWSHLRDHLLSHSSNNVDSEQDSCVVCYFSVDSHKVFVLGSAVSSCFHCSLIFTDKKIIRLHLKLEHCDILYPNQQIRCFLCSFCLKTFFRPVDIRRHMQNIHDHSILDENAFSVSTLKDLSFSCQICEEMCFMAKFCVKHKPTCVKSMCSEHGTCYPNCHSCQRCDVSFEDCNQLWSHMFIEHGKNELVCNLCKYKSFTILIKYAHTLIRHMKLHHEIPLRIPSVIMLMKKETKVVVDGVVRYKCFDCSTDLPTFLGLKNHLDTHVDETIFACHVCSKYFSRNYLLEMHIKYNHEGIRDFQCQDCGKFFVTAYKLEKHVDRMHFKDIQCNDVHIGSCKYICETCGEFFANKKTLEIHKYSHSDITFMCDICGHSYNNPVSLSSHIKKVHACTIVCEICGKEFKSQTRLKEHMSIHDNSKPFICKTCSLAFSLKKQLHQHSKIHFKIE